MRSAGSPLGWLEMCDQQGFNFLNFLSTRNLLGLHLIVLKSINFHSILFLFHSLYNQFSPFFSFTNYFLLFSVKWNLSGSILECNRRVWWRLQLSLNFNIKIRFLTESNHWQQQELMRSFRFLPLYKNEAKISGIKALPSCANGIFFDPESEFPPVHPPAKSLAELSC